MKVSLYLYYFVPLIRFHISNNRLNVKKYLQVFGATKTQRAFLINSETIVHISSENSKLKI